MLTKIVSQAAAFALTTKTIAVTRSSTQQNGSVMYTVPAGRKFVGLIGHNANYYLTIDNNDIGPFSSGAGVPWQVPIQLAAGAVVKSYGSTSGSSMLFGVESDA